MYILECASRGLSIKTVATRSHDLYDLLVYAKGKGIKCAAEIGNGLLDEYLSVRNDKAPKAMPLRWNVFIHI